MDDIVFDGKILKIEKFLNFGRNFLVFKALDQFKNSYSVKRTSLDFDGPPCFDLGNSVYRTNSSFDLLTSAYYGHSRIDLNIENINEILIYQAKYLKLCGDFYNLKTYGIQKDQSNQLCLINSYVEGDTLNITGLNSKITLWSILPSLLVSLSKFPHGDIKEDHILIHKNNKKFTILDPASRSNDIFETNSEYYPIVPPLFYYSTDGFMNYSDQLAIGIMVYKVLTGKHPFEKYRKEPFWVKEFGSGYAPYPSIKDIYPFMTIFPKWYSRKTANHEPNESFNSILYLQAIRENFLAINRGTNRYKFEFLNLPTPKELNNSITREESDFCMSLITNYLPVSDYLKSFNSIVK